MGENNYILDLNDPKCWLRVNYDQRPGQPLNEEQRIILYPEGSHEQFEFTDSIFYGQTTYHEHDYGWEFFFMGDGAMDFTAHGKTTTVEEGDMLVVQPYCSHEMKFLRPSRWRATFHDMGMSNVLNNWNRMMEYHSDRLNDILITNTYLENRHNIIREPAYAKRVPKSEMYEVRNKDQYISRYDFDGITMKQMLARWESNGVNEIWRFELEEQCGIKYREIDPNTELLWVTDGEVEFTINNEKYSAYKDCLIKIPSFVPHSFIAKKASVLYDIGGMTHWLDCIEDLLSVYHNNYEKTRDKEYMDKIFFRHSCYVDSFILKSDNHKKE